MRQDRAGKMVFTLFSVVWTGIAILLICLTVPEMLADYKIINNGEKLTAVVVDARVDTSYTENGKNYWYMVYDYEYQGKVYRDTTSSSYDENEVLDAGETLEILYYNGDAVQADYEMPNSYIFLMIFIVVSLGVGVGMGIAAVRSFKKSGHSKRLKESGQRTKAKFVSTYSNYKVNNVPYYRVKYTYTDGFGINREEKSLGYVSRDEAYYLEQLGEFEIAYDGKASVIVEDLIDRKPITMENYEHVEPLAEESTTVVNTNTKHQCPSCGAVAMPNSDGSCPYCGAYIRNN